MRVVLVAVVAAVVLAAILAGGFFARAFVLGLQEARPGIGATATSWRPATGGSRSPSTTPAAGWRA